MKRFRRITTRKGYTEAHWQEGYEFLGIAYPQYDQVEENDGFGLIRIHNFKDVEEVN